jgi:hypothetical protein
VLSKNSYHSYSEFEFGLCLCLIELPLYSFISMHGSYNLLLQFAITGQATAIVQDMHENFMQLGQKLSGS